MNTFDSSTDDGSGLPAIGVQPGPGARRSRLRAAAVGGLAAAAILGGGIAAVAAPATGRAGSGTAASAPTAPGTTAPGTATSGTAAPAAPAPRPHVPHLAGTVTAVNGSTGLIRELLVKDRDGFTRTIVVSAGTSYRDGLTAVPTVGAKIRAEGTVAANGTSLDATVVALDKAPLGKGPHGGPGGGRPGPRGEHAGPPPAGAPAAPGAAGTAGKAPSGSSGSTLAPTSSSTVRPTS